MDNNDTQSKWKFGIIFYDPENEKVFVPKRFGIGWTLNFARWQTLLIIAALVVTIAISFFEVLK